MDIHLYFPNLLSNFGGYGIRDLNIMLLSICIFPENWYRKAHTFLTGSNGITFIHVMTTFSVSTTSLLPPIHSSLGQGMGTFHRHHYDCKSNCQYGQVIATLCSRNHDITLATLSQLGIQWVMTESSESLTL